MKLAKLYYYSRFVKEYCKAIFMKALALIILAKEKEATLRNEGIRKEPKRKVQSTLFIFPSVLANLSSGQFFESSSERDRISNALNPRNM